MQAFNWVSCTDKKDAKVKLKFGNFRLFCASLICIIPVIVCFVISMKTHGESDGMRYLMKNFADEPNINLYMAKYKLAPTFEISIVFIVLFSIGKSLLVLCFHFSSDYYFLTNRNCSILARDAMYIRWRDLHFSSLEIYLDKKILNFE